ncbi:hypothetical protein Back11_11770 [Paenibacillus baekrokdamisoli]|uniref:Uncharacterized protein n=1 Tax=Paenibacillus baekrokdamisoli TaxID=1712516 RepID=A0A3G9INL8_9BACL|nr:tape measure protein [Paenibacillus baekrokdamisoli]MBB3070482.1 tape measure domain-containing protein [Paenibacillus baekrokdamisoli]BBH19832.1 hypothetical protein Back11_11770 [Paenibacillus baekrokdamisoli]
MATVSASLKMFDQFSQTLDRANQRLEQVLGIAERVKRELQDRISIEVDMSGAVAHIEQVRQQLTTMGHSVAIQVIIDADGITQEINRIQQQIRSGVASAAIEVTINSTAAIQEAATVRTQIEQQLGTISAEIHLQVPNASQLHSQLRTLLQGIGGAAVNIQVHLDTAHALAEVRTLNSRIIAEIGTIRAQIQIQLPASLTMMFTNLQRLVLRLLVAVRQLSAVSGNTQQLQAALQRIAALEARINQLQEQLNGRLREGGNASSGMATGLKGIVAAYVSIATIHKAIDFVNWADGIASTNARLGMMNDGTQTQLELQQKVMAVANDTRQAYQETAKMVAQLGSSTQGVFKSNSDVLAFTSRFNKLLATGGATAEESKSSILQMSQALSSGVLQGDELRSLSENAPMLMKVLADGLGVSRGSLKKLGADGKLTSDAVVQAFAKQDKYINTIFEKMPVTFGQAMTAAKNKAVGWISILNGANGPIQKLTKSIMGLINWMDTKEGQGMFNGLTAGIRIASDSIAWFIDFLTKHMDIVKNVLFAVGVVVLGLAVYWLIMWASAAWPVFAVIGAIALLISLLNYFGVSTQTIVGFVGGVFSAFFAYLWNSVATVWNLILMFAEFFINVFIDPVYAVKKLFYDLAQLFMGNLYNMLRSAEDFAGNFMKVVLEGINGVVKGLNWMIEAMNNLPGVDIPTAKLFDTDNVHAMSDGIKKMMDSMEAPTSDKGVVDLSKYKMKPKNLSDAFDVGNKYGKDLFTKAVNAGDSIKKKGDAWSGNINKVNEVGKIGGKVDISSEDIKQMRELAEMKNIQNFVTLTPQITFGDTHVRNESDMGTIISKIKDHLEGEIVASAEGVYGG